MSQRKDEHDDQEILVGGEKGHIVEPIRGNVRVLYQALSWKPIPRCTGRYTSRNHDTVASLSPLQLLQFVGIPTEGLARYDITLPGRPDPIVIVAMDTLNTSGIIAYQKGDGTFVHTLNAVSGFRRKLNAIGIHVTDDMIWFDGEDPT